MTTKEKLELLEKRLLEAYELSIVIGLKPHRVTNHSLQSLIVKLNEATALAKNVQADTFLQANLEDYLLRFRRVAI